MGILAGVGHVGIVGAPALWVGEFHFVILILDALAGLSGIYEKILWTATSFSPSISLRPVLATSLAICFA